MQTSIHKVRGKSAALLQNDMNRMTKGLIPAPTSLLKIEPFVPTLTARIRKPIHRSYSSLSTSYFKHGIEQKNRISRHPERNLLTNQRSRSSLSTSFHSQNGFCRINRPPKEQEKMPDRINYDRRGLTAIPVFENENSLRLLSLQHNLINIFHIPDETKQNSKIDFMVNSDSKQSTNLEPELSVTISNTNNNANVNPNNSAKSNRNELVAKRNMALSPTTAAFMFPSNINVNTNINLCLSGVSTPKLMQNSNSNSSTSSYNSISKSSFVQKPVILHSHQKYALKRSKSFVSNYTKHFNTIKQNLQKCALAKPCNLTSYGNENTASNDNISELEDNVLDKNANENNLEDLAVKNQQFNPVYGNIFQNLVFLDLYDNQIEKISNLDGLKSLTVLLLGKNRISDITGLASLKYTLRVLDLHGNKITGITNKINCLQELKSLNLAGNQIKQINQNDFAGLLNLKELNLKRNRIKRLHGFNHLTNLERLWLCHNDIQKVEDMSSVAKAINLQEVTIENNPVSLAGDCVSFLVSYLPNLIMLSQMPITEQVRRAAMAWRKNKEHSDANYSNLTSDVSSSIRREEVISNARTNWELLRSQQMMSAPSKKMTLNPPSSPTASPYKQESDTEKNSLNIQSKFMKSKSSKIHAKNKQAQKNIKQNRQSENIPEIFRLPPILQPYANSNRSSSGSSLGPNIDSSSSCYSTENEEHDKQNNSDNIAIRVPQMSEQTALDYEDAFCEILPVNVFKEVMVIEKPNENIETVTTTNSNNPDKQAKEQIAITEISNNANLNTNSGNDSASQSDKNSNMSASSVRSESDISNLNTNQTEKPTSSRSKHSTFTKRYMHGTLMRSQTAKPRTSSYSHNQTSNNTNANSALAKSSKLLIEREREQGGDYLIEICGRYLNIYGLGALRFIDKQWNTQKANDVHTLNFSYINFNNIMAILNRIKLRFPNAESFVFRETNINSLGQLNALAELQGIASLVIDPEGNLICSKDWRPYAIYRLSHWGLKSINGTEITEDEIEKAQTEYTGLSDLVLWSLPESLLQPLLTRLRLDESCSASKLSAKEWLMKADQSLKSVVGKEALQWRKAANSTQDDAGVRERGKVHFTVMIENMCNAVEKLQKLEVLWPNLLLDIVRNTLLDYSQFDVYIKNLMAEIMK